MNIRLQEYKDTIETPEVTSEIRDTLKRRMRKGDTVKLDFNGIHSVSSNFLKKIIGGVINEFGFGVVRHRVIFQNTNAVIKSMLEVVLKDLLGKK